MASQDNYNIPDNNPILKSNLELLKSKDPILHNKILESEPVEILEKIIDDGNIISLTIPGKEGKPLVFQSKKAEPNVVRLTQYQDITNYDVIVIEGFGLGEHILEIIEASSESTFILIIEQDIKFFKQIINYIDLDLIIRDRVNLSVNEPPFHATRKRLEDYFGVFTIDDIKIFSDPVSIESEPKYYDEIDKQLEELQEIAEQNQETLKKFAGIWQRHILSNIKPVVLEPGVNELFNKFKGVPTILVSAGPSLDKNLHWIAHAKGKALIVAVDTAFRSLLKHDIKPDFVISLDALEYNYMHFEGIKESETCLIANPVTHPAIIKEYAGPVFIMNFGDPLMTWIEKSIGKKGDTLSGGSVATSLFDLVYKLGSSPIIFTGQDMSYPGFRSYTEYCYFDQTWLDGLHQSVAVNDFHKSKISSENTFYKKGIFDGNVATSAKMFSWKNWFETIIEQFNIHCINSTEDGLSIKGAENKTLKEAINKYCNKSVDIKKTILEVQSKYETADIKSFIANLKELKTNMGRIGYLSAEGKNVSSTLLNILENMPQDQLKLNSHLQKMNIFAEQILNEQEFIEMNKWCIDVLLEKMKIDDKAQSKKRKESEIISQNIKSYKVLFDGIDDMCSHYGSKLDNAIGELDSLL